MDGNHLVQVRPAAGRTASSPGEWLVDPPAPWPQVTISTAMFRVYRVYYLLLLQVRVS